MTTFLTIVGIVYGISAVGMAAVFLDPRSYVDLDDAPDEVMS